MGGLEEDWEGVMKLIYCTCTVIMLLRKVGIRSKAGDNGNRNGNPRREADRNGCDGKSIRGYLIGVMNGVWV